MKRKKVEVALLVTFVVEEGAPAVEVEDLRQAVLEELDGWSVEVDESTYTAFCNAAMPADAPVKKMFADRTTVVAHDEFV